MNSAVRKALTDWVGPTAIWSHQNTPRPKTPYFTLQIISFAQIGDDYEGMPNNEEIAQMRGDREFTLSIQAIGANAISRLDALRFSLQQFSVREDLAKHGIVYVRTEGIQDIAALLEETFEERASLDVLFRLGIGNVTVHVPVIRAVDLTTNIYEKREEFVQDPVTNEEKRIVVEENKCLDTTTIEEVEINKGLRSKFA